MSTLLVFTENYWPGVAGASYLVDLANGASTGFERVVLAYNPEALNDVDIRKLTMPVETAHVRVLTSARVWALLHRRSRLLTIVLVRLTQLLDPLVMAYNALLCRRLLRQVRPSAVLSFNGGYPAARSTLSMTIAANRQHVPNAFAVVSMPAARRPALRWYEAWLDRRVGAAADVIIVNAAAIGRALSTVRGLPGAKMRVVHNALADANARVKHTAGDSLTIGCVARMDSGKGILDLVHAFGSIAEGHPDVRLVLIGDGPELPRLRSEVRDRGLADRISLPGYYDGEVAEVLSTFQIYAYPSLWEGLPYAILEAMRAGCAIVSTDVGGVSEAIIDGQTGLLVPPGSPIALAAALEKLITDSDMRLQLASAARERFETEFSLDVMHARTAQVFADCGLT
ncbi:MAG: glycosyltransferase [Clostridiales bacterium]|nr:glycosyltransferase [Clostridiales bacterium]